MTWADYTAIPWREKGRGTDGVDCYGLLRLVYARELGVELPGFEGIGYCEGCDRRALAEAIDRFSTDWRPVPLAEALPFDAVRLRTCAPLHIGIVVAPPRFLHVEAGVDSCIERWDSLRWKRRIFGVYRHASRC